MPQTPAPPDSNTPIFDALAAELGFEWVGWFDPNTAPEPARDQ
jgi:hypothetical protein